MKEEKNKKYKAYAFKLSLDTIKNLKKNKKNSGKTWNLFIYSLIKKDEEKEKDIQR